MSSCRGTSAGEAPPPPAQPPAAAPGHSPDAPVGELAAPSLHLPGPGEGGDAGGDASATGQHTPSPRSRCAGADAAAPGASSGAPPVGGDGAGAARAAPGPPASTSLSAVAARDVGPSEPTDGGDELSAEVAASPFSPPATERHAAFLKLVDSATKASLQKRDQRCADFTSLAAEAAVPLFGDDSPSRRKNRGPAGFAEAGALRRRAWVVLVSLSLPVMQGRIDKGTVLPGKCRPAEEAYQVYTQQLINRVTEKPEPSVAALKPIAACVGYDDALQAAYTALNLLPLLLGNAAQRDRAQAFVFSVLGLIPHTAVLTVTFAVENTLVDIIDNNPSRYHPGFWASLQALWRSPAVAGVLRSRGALQGGAAATAALAADFESRQAADKAKKGLRAGGLPLCGKQETTVLQFRVCGHCQRTRYCCPEHAKQHWPVHKREREDGENSSGSGAV